MGKKGQTTIFVILAIIVVVGAFLVYNFFPQIKSTFEGVDENPQSYIRTCLEDDFYEQVNLISLQGGNLWPTNYYIFNNSNINYLCYTSEYYKNCVVQVPFLKETMEEQLVKAMKEKISSCFNQLDEDYSEKGNKLNIQAGEAFVEFLPDHTKLTINNKVTVTKEDTKTYEEFTILLNNNLYEVIGVARSIIEHESVIGQAETTDFMSLYRNLKVEKLKQTDGTKIYVITDKKTQDKFQLASRSQVFPPGYA
jgi:hypothetical protein